MNSGSSETTDLNVHADERGLRLRAEHALRASRVRGIVADYIRAHAEASPESCDAAELIVGELLGNVVRHAPGPFEILLAWEPAGGVLRVIDSGPGFDLNDVGLPDAAKESSRGLFLVQAVGARSVRTYRAADGRHVTELVLPLRRSPIAST